MSSCIIAISTRVFCRGLSTCFKNCAALRDDVNRRELAVYEMRSARLRTEILVSDRQNDTADGGALEEHPWLPGGGFAK